MKQPTDFNDDLLHLSDFSDRLEAFIKVERDFVDGSLVIALNSSFGSGKTTFLRMWESKFEKSEPKNDRPLVINLNAWESDYYGDPLFAIISSLVESLKGRRLFARSKPIISAAERVGLFGMAISNQVMRKVTGIDIIEARNFSKTESSNEKEIKTLESDAFSIYQDRKDAMVNLKEKIKDFVTKFEPPVLFFVDELDRCRPDYAISYLETVKHIFDVEGAVFILAADKHHLENSARRAFGSNLNFDEYYRKFVHREITFPPISESTYKALASNYTYYYLERENLRRCFMDIDSDMIERIAQLVGVLQMTPRQTQEAFRILGHVCERTRKEAESKLRWCFSVGTIAMAAFKINKPKIYKSLSSQKCDPKEFFELLTNSLRKADVEWWFNLFLTGGGLKINEEDSEIGIIIKVGMRSRTIESHEIGDDLQKWFRSWDRWDKDDPNRFAEIYEKIEQVSKWD